MILIKNRIGAGNILVYLLFILLAACASSNMSFIEPNKGFGDIRTVAIMPFENLSSDKTGAERVRDVFTNRLLSTGVIYTIPPGEVTLASLRAGVVDPTTPAVEEIIKLSVIAKVDAVITGVVREYGEVRSGGAAANIVSFSLKLIEAKSGRTVGEASSTKGGITIKERLSGGGGQPLNDVTIEAVNDVINQYFRLFSAEDKEYAKIPDAVFLQKSDGGVKAEESLDKVQQETQQFKKVEKSKSKVALVVKSIALIEKAVYSPIENESHTQQLKEAEQKNKDSLKETTKSKKASPLLKEKGDTPSSYQNHNAIGASSNEDDNNIVQARPDDKIETTSKSIDDLTIDSQYGANEIYTIQIGSFLELEPAQKQYDSILQILNRKEISLLRIEKIGKFFSVRLGRFSDYSTAEQFIIEAKPRLSHAVILKAYIKEERMIKAYPDSVSVLNGTP